MDIGLQVSEKGEIGQQVFEKGRMTFTCVTEPLQSCHEQGEGFKRHNRQGMGWGLVQ